MSPTKCSHALSRLLATASILVAIAAWGRGDRHPSLNIVYPAGAFIHNGGRIIDVTKPPYSAAGDGVTDDTQALIAAYDFVAGQMEQHGWHNNDASYILYFPEGTYLVSDTIVYSGPRIHYEHNRGMARLRLVGQNRENTTIRLRDNCPGFGPGANKPVVAYQKDYEGGEGTNVPAANQCCNLTIDTGVGNPGAIGLMFLGANSCAMSNVTIRSGDGAGFVGLDLPVWSVQGHMKDITIEGFDHGIRVLHMAETNPVFEYVTLRNQRRAGVLVERGSPCLRKILSENRCPALNITNTAAQVVILDSLLTGGDAETPAIALRETSSQLFARDVRVSGYGSSVVEGDRQILNGNVDEYVSGGVFSLFEGQPPQSMRLPVQDAPILQWEQDMSQWANVDEFEGEDDAEKIQNAMNSGRSTVYFPGSTYDIAEPVEIPATVKHIDFMYSSPNTGARIVIAEESEDPLWIEHWSGRGYIIQRAPRTVVTRNISAEYQNQQSEPTKLFLESHVNIGASPHFCKPGQRIWARSIDSEYKHTSNFKVFGGTMWVLGHKTEGHRVSFEVRNGGFCEVLGGYRNETTPDEGRPMVLNRNSNVSFVGYTSMAAVYEGAVREVRNDITGQLTRTDLPQRKGYRKDFYIPLYVGYDPQALQSLSPAVEGP